MQGQPMQMQGGPTMVAVQVGTAVVTNVGQEAYWVDPNAQQYGTYMPSDQYDMYGQPNGAWVQYTDFPRQDGSAGAGMSWEPLEGNPEGDQGPIMVPVGGGDWNGGGGGDWNGGGGGNGWPKSNNWNNNWKSWGNSGWKKSSGEKWSAKEEDRQMVDGEHYNGVVMHSGNNFGWVKPTDALPISVQEPLSAMMGEHRSKAAAKGESFFEDDVVYVHITDVEFGTKIQEGMAVRFQLYTDHRGVGACDVQATSVEPQMVPLAATPPGVESAPVSTAFGHPGLSAAPAADFGDSNGFEPLGDDGFEPLGGDGFEPL